jgi:cysteine desulfurase/selenocysteine lyase
VSTADSALLPLAALAPRSDFPLLARNPELHYLDSAATSQKPQAVLDAITGFYETANANPHRGAYALSAAATDAYHDARATVARFLGVADADCLIFTRGTTESMNLVASSWGRTNVRAGDEIVITALEHHANFVPWQQLALASGATLRIVELTSDQSIDLDALRAAVNPRTKVVAITAVSNAVGAITPLAEVVRIVRTQSSAVIVLDGAQAVPHLPVTFDASDVDFFAFSGHKMLGPMGIGGLVGKRALLEAMPPFQFGGDMIEWVNDADSTWNVLPHKFEAGTPNAADAVGLAAAVRYLEALGMENVRAHEVALLERADARLRAMPGVTVYGPPPAARSGVISFSVDGVHPHDLATIFDQHGVCIRAGHHCAQPLMRRLGVSSTARASFYVYSDSRDVDALCEALRAAQTMFAHTV